MTKAIRSNGQFVYSVYGSGSKILLAFHGLGQNRKFFEEWSEILGDIFTIYAFDLFYHGESVREPGKLSKEELADYLNEFLQKEKIDTFSCLGYSLGGRFAISTALSFPKRIQKLILIAPDGIFLTIWFKLATTPIIRYLFKLIMVHPELLERLVRWNDRVKVINKYMADFIRKEMGNAENRKRVYVSWNHFKTLGYKRKVLIRDFNKHTFKRKIVLGSKDYVIKPKGIIPILNKMTGFDISIIEKKHHQLLDVEVAQLIKSNLQK